MNRENLEIVRDVLLMEKDLPENFKFDMGTYASGCKTAGCIAGLAVAIFDPIRWGKRSTSGIKESAEFFLGLEYKESDNLFEPCNVEPTSVSPKRAANAIQHLLDGKKLDSWWTGLGE